MSEEILESSTASLFQQISDLSASLCSQSSAQLEKSSSGCIQPAYLSEIEAAVLRALSPIPVSETEEVNVFGNRGIWTNRIEELNWKGELPLSQYELNEDSTPEIITKKYVKDVEYIQELAVRYLRPPPLPAPGEIIITQEPNYLAPPAPPLVIRQQPPRPCTPQPLVVREQPPPPPVPVGKKIITISGKRLPPPPRKVIIERLPPVPAKPQAVITERWLPYVKAKRRVIYQAAPPDPVYCKPKNVIVQWDPPNVTVRQEVKFLGVVNANPSEYVKRYGETLKPASELPEISKNIPTQEGYVLASEVDSDFYELEGDIEALKLVDLDAEGLSMYKSYLTNETSLKLASNESTHTLTASSVRLSTSSTDLSRDVSPRASLVDSTNDSPKVSTTVLSVSQLLASARPSKSALKSESTGLSEKRARIVESFNQEFDITRESVNTTLDLETERLSPSSTSALEPEELKKLVESIKKLEE